MKSGKITFKKAYLIYTGVLLVLVLGAVLYVRGLLNRYEESQPERRVEQVMEQLQAQAADGSFWDVYGEPDWENGPWEQGMDLKAAYLAQYADGVSCAEKRGLGSEDELVYHVEYRGFPLAEVRLKAAGPAVTKLAVFSMREWQVESVTPLPEPVDLKLTLPEQLQVKVNGEVLSAPETDSGKAEYELTGLHTAPSLEITDSQGNRGSFRFQGERVLVRVYNYKLQLPQGLTVTVNGKEDAGELLADGRVSHRICLLAEPEVVIRDLFGNELEYHGESSLPMTHMTVRTAENYQVLVDGAPVPPEAVRLEADPDYAPFADFVPDLLKTATSHIAVLKADAQVTVTDETGRTETLSGEEEVYSFGCEPEPLAQVPEEVSREVDVLQVAQDWSLFMSCDLDFEDMIPALLEGSYQYDVADQYAHGVDITFTSTHSLLNPAFTEESVTNFTWITENCFSVDIHFVKHMLLSTGAKADDEMNDTFYFVRGGSSGWKLASMKEIIDHGE